MSWRETRNVKPCTKLNCGDLLKYICIYAYLGTDSNIHVYMHAYNLTECRTSSQNCSLWTLALAPQICSVCRNDWKETNPWPFFPHKSVVLCQWRFHKSSFCVKLDLQGINRKLPGMWTFASWRRWRETLSCSVADSILGETFSYKSSPLSHSLGLQDYPFEETWQKLYLEKCGPDKLLYQLLKHMTLLEPASVPCAPLFLHAPRRTLY